MDEPYVPPCGRCTRDAIAEVASQYSIDPLCQACIAEVGNEWYAKLARLAGLEDAARRVLDECGYLKAGPEGEALDALREALEP